jgi:hypothetical protein
LGEIGAGLADELVGEEVAVAEDDTEGHGGAFHKKMSEGEIKG